MGEDGTLGLLIPSQVVFFNKTVVFLAARACK